MDLLTHLENHTQYPTISMTQKACSVSNYSYGFIAFLPSVVVSLISLMGALGMGGYIATIYVLGQEYEALIRADLAAYSCVSLALFEHAIENTYQPTESGDAVWLSPNSSCRIHQVHQRENRITIVASGTYEDRTVFITYTE